MAYNYYPFFGNSQFNNPAMQQGPQMTPMQNTQMRSDFVVVRSEDEARNFPVAFGNTVTFKNESEPYMYTKTMGMSQLDRPVFEKYKLIKEQSHEEKQEENKSPDPDIVDKIQTEIKSIWKEIEILKKKTGPRKTTEEISK
jgi:hypothetical protein